MVSNILVALLDDLEARGSLEQRRNQELGQHQTVYLSRREEQSYGLTQGVHPCYPAVSLFKVPRGAATGAEKTEATRH